MLKRSSNAVRRAVAHVIAFVAFCFDRPGRFFAVLAGHVYPATAAGRISAPSVVKESAPTTYTVLRWQHLRHWMLYRGPDGGEARRRYEVVKAAAESGRMEFQMTIPGGGYVVRGVYENGES